jgi:hypothetical protein
MKAMKRILYILLLAATAVVGCKKINPVVTLEQLLQGQWRGSETSVDAAIYIEFMKDHTFELYQKMDTEGFELRRGTWTLSGDILSGAYNDGQSWAASYKISIIEGTSTLTMVSQNEGGETNTYQGCWIPDGVKENCTVVVKSRLY